VDRRAGGLGGGDLRCGKLGVQLLLLLLLLRKLLLHLLHLL
jgi:hypothetical protein